MIALESHCRIALKGATLFTRSATMDPFSWRAQGRSFSAEQVLADVSTCAKLARGRFPSLQTCVKHTVGFGLIVPFMLTRGSGCQPPPSEHVTTLAPRSGTRSSLPSVRQTRSIWFPRNERFVVDMSATLSFGIVDVNSEETFATTTFSPRLLESRRTQPPFSAIMQGEVRPLSVENRPLMQALQFVTDLLFFWVEYLDVGQSLHAVLYKMS